MGLVTLVLECIGINGIESQAQVPCQFSQRRQVIDLVPGEVGRYPRRRTAKLLYDRTVFQTFVNIGGFTRNGKSGESRAAPAGAPSGNGNAEGGNLSRNRSNILTPPRQLPAQEIVVFLQNVALPLVLGPDQVQGNGEAARLVNPWAMMQLFSG